MLEIVSFDTLPSTQIYLSNIIESNKVDKEIAVVANNQTDAIGSRGSEWISKRGNLFCSIALKKHSLPTDLPLSATSIYFAYLLKEVLFECDNRVWVKWPNDLYIDNLKCGGVITWKKRDFFIVGIGVNFVEPTPKFGYVECKYKADRVVEIYLEKLKQKYKWKHLFSNYRIEFEKSKQFSFHHNGEKMNLDRAVLCEDGSVLINGERIVNLR